MIPRRVSLFWSGRMGWLRYLTLATLRRQNPDWQITLYSPSSPCLNDPTRDDARSEPDYRERLTDLDIRQEAYTLPRSALTRAQSCDLCEWDVLANVGGFFSDMDVLWLRPLDCLPESAGDAGAVFYLERGMLAVGLLASSGRCPLFQDLLSLALSDRHADRRDYQSYGTRLIYSFAGMPSRSLDGQMAVDRLRRTYPSLNVATVLGSTVYPFDWRQVRGIFEESHPVPPETVGLHWFGGDATSRRWNGLLTEENWRGYDSTFARTLRRVLV